MRSVLHHSIPVLVEFSGKGYPSPESRFLVGGVPHTEKDNSGLGYMVRFIAAYTVDVLPREYKLILKTNLFPSGYRYESTGEDFAFLSSRGPI
jgi:hypothetical protein